jgi:Putative peptidoglycan binding domain
MGMERPPDRPPDEGSREEDWLGEQWLEEATEETPPSRRRRPARPEPPRPDRRVLALVAAAAIVLAIILAFVLGDDGGGDEAGPTTPTVTQTDTATTTPPETEPSDVVPEGQTLSEGDSGRRVRQLQRALAALGYDVASDGEYGPATTEAVTAFQEDEGLDADGAAGRETIRAINEALANRG